MYDNQNSPYSPQTAYGGQTTTFLLLENGGFILQENRGKIILTSSAFSGQSSPYSNQSNPYS